MEHGLDSSAGIFHEILISNSQEPLAPVGDGLNILIDNVQN
jgi:hypothetical protein